MAGEVIFQNPYPNQAGATNGPVGLSVPGQFNQNNANIASFNPNAVSSNQDLTQNSRMSLGTTTSEPYNQQNGEVPIFVGGQQVSSQGYFISNQNQTQNNQFVPNPSEPNQSIGAMPSVPEKKQLNSSIISVLFIVWIGLGMYYFLGGNFSLNMLKGEFGQDFNILPKSDLSSINSNADGSINNVTILDDAAKENPSDQSELTKGAEVEASLDDIDKMFLANTLETKKSSNLPVTQASSNDNRNDPDLDEISNQAEVVLGTDPNNSDTDSDSLSDYQEISIYHTNPLKDDSDGDGLSDSEEILIGKNPNKKGL